MRIASTITWLMLIHGALATQRVVVTFETREIAALPHKISNATIIRQYGRRIVLDLGRAAVLPEAWIGEMLGVHVTVELDSMVGVSTITWNLADSEPHSIHVEKLWARTKSTPDVYIAVLDSGVAEVAKGSFAHLVPGYDFISDKNFSLDGDGRDPDSTDPGDAGPDCLDPSWHGTMVTSIIAADHQNPYGVLGVAPDASVISIRVLGLCGAGYTADVTDAIVWAVGGVINGVPMNPHPAKIIDLSLEGDGLCPSFLQSAINQAHNSGAMVYAAAGNDAFDTIANIFPANCENVVSVGAITKSGALAPYSNMGADVLAPGGDEDDPIYVLSVFDGVLSGAFTVGTSMAVAHVAGLAALNIVINTVNCPSPSNAITPGASSYMGCKCPKGTYGRVTNATHAECITCPLGQYCPAASVACAC